MPGPSPKASCSTFAGQRVLFLMAVEDEYGPHLRQRIIPALIGVGPVEAAIATSLVLHRMNEGGELPDLVVSLGSAGSRRCALGQVYQVSTVSWRDMDASRLGFARGVTPFTDHPVDIPLHAPLPLPTARLSTGANIVGGDDYALIDADMVDMETFAIARACQRFGVPLMGLRGISDGPGDLVDMHGWTSLLAHLDEQLARAVDLLAE